MRVGNRCTGCEPVCVCVCFWSVTLPISPCLVDTAKATSCVKHFVGPVLNDGNSPVLSLYLLHTSRVFSLLVSEHVSSTQGVLTRCPNSLLVRPEEQRLYSELSVSDWTSYSRLSSSWSINQVTHPGCSHPPPPAHLCPSDEGSSSFPLIQAWTGRSGDSIWRRGDNTFPSQMFSLKSQTRHLNIKNNLLLEYFQTLLVSYNNKTFKLAFLAGICIVCHRFCIS